MMSRIVVIGLDAFHKDLLQFTPKIESLFTNNPGGILESTTPPVTAPAWASFQTGKNQGKHGLYDFVEFDNNMNTSILDGTSLHSKTFYEILDDAGYDCFLFNLPFSSPARIEGDIVPSWLDSDSHPPEPKDLYDRYDIESPRYPSFGGGVKENIEKMRFSVDHNGEQFLKVLGTEDHDFLFQLVSETDWLQHDAYFHLFERPESDIGKAAEDVLAKVDEHIAKIDDLLHDDDRLLLISDHGFTGFEKQLYINDWLKEEGYLVSGGTEIGTKSDSSKSVNFGQFGQFLFRQEWLHPALTRLKSVIEGISGLNVSSESGIDLSESDAFCLSKDEHAIRLSNDLDDGVREEIRGEILDKLNAEHGIKAYPREDVYHGPYIDGAGDIIFSSNDCQIWRGPSGLVWRNSRKAHHSPNGFISGIGFDDNDSNDEIRASLLDVSPTILGIADCAIPNDIDGDPILEFLSKEPEYTEPTEYNVSTNNGAAQPNQDAEERLRDLGYL